MMKKYIWLLLKILSVLLVLTLFVYDLLFVYYFYSPPSFSMQGSEEMVTTGIGAIVTVPLIALGHSVEIFSNLASVYASVYVWFLSIMVNIGLLFSLIFTVIIFKEKLKLLVIASLLLLAVLLFLFGF